MEIQIEKITASFAKVEINGRLYIDPIDRDEFRERLEALFKEYEKA